MDSLKKYLSLPIPRNTVIATYVWNIGEVIKSKNRTLNFIPTAVESIPDWSFDGYSTNLAVINQSDINLVPRRMYKNPFIKGNHIIVLCETYDYTYQPTEVNTRHSCVKICEKTEDFKPLFGIEQEYYLIDEKDTSSKIHNENHYCGLGISYRSLVDAHYFCCLYSGIDICGTNAECGNNQWEFQLGPSGGIKICDDLWVARYLLLQLAEECGLKVSFKTFPEGISTTEPTSGGHFNFSTKSMREYNGISEIYSAINKLSLTHKESIECYAPKNDTDNIKRLSGKGETSKHDNFTHGVGDRAVSVRIPIQVSIDEKGYLEDRRPASNCDPYQVVESILRSTLTF